jgi:hypothetical protein
MIIVVECMKRLKLCGSKIADYDESMIGKYVCITNNQQLTTTLWLGIIRSQSSFKPIKRKPSYDDNIERKYNFPFVQGDEVHLINKKEMAILMM